MNNKQLYVGAYVVRTSGIQELLKVTKLEENNQVLVTKVGGSGQEMPAYSSYLRLATEDEVKNGI